MMVGVSRPFASSALADDAYRSADDETPTP